jgi:chromosome segregation ATPase
MLALRHEFCNQIECFNRILNQCVFGRFQLTAAQRSLAEHQADGAKNVQAVSTSEQAVNTQKARLAAAQRELNEVIAQENEANERLASTRAKLEDARAAAASSGRASSSIADAFTKLRKTKDFAGVHGRLGDLGMHNYSLR